ncbi:hypothetical protein L227DRAFT_577284 [Lentinus tigrinus ALCF2SS1-6]|uniref:Secreted protein n=1 Tax=Lentinus tigrinus ALCF2SS1-6 TaxID=1328759 RepID=A0A5C2S3P3_9APHY|nr:hypothetical protein L227DRAFT_577284 [Lentinus tigrinus ALCF2SS1-6]
MWSMRCGRILSNRPFRSGLTALSVLFLCPVLRPTGICARTSRRKVTDCQVCDSKDSKEAPHNSRCFGEKETSHGGWILEDGLSVGTLFHISRAGKAQTAPGAPSSHPTYRRCRSGIPMDVAPRPLQNLLSLESHDCEQSRPGGSGKLVSSGSLPHE